MSLYALLGCLSGLIFGLMGTLLARAIALKLGFVCKPNPISKQHTRPVAYMGGLGIAIAVAVTSIGAHLLHWPVALPAPLLIASAVFIVIGLIDDIVMFNVPRKFASQVVGTIIAVAIGNRAGVLPTPIDTFLSAFWVLTMINAVNFTDVCDGLAASIAAVTLGFLAILVPSTAFFAMTTAGACLGVWRFNKAPASISLGEAGACVLGFLFATISLQYIHAGAPLLHLGQTVLVCGVALFELVFITAVRIRKGLPWWKGSPDHFSFRLQKAGLTRTQTDAVAAGLAACFGMLALWQTSGSTPAIVATWVAAAVIVVVFWRFLLRHDAT